MTGLHLWNFTRRYIIRNTRERRESTRMLPNNFQNRNSMHSSYCTAYIRFYSTGWSRKFKAVQGSRAVSCESRNPALGNVSHLWNSLGVISYELQWAPREGEQYLRRMFV
jgi:hypothetical protein